MLKRVLKLLLGGVMYSLFIIFMSMSCAHIITEGVNNTAYLKPNKTENSSSTPSINNNFVGLQKFFLLDENGDYCLPEEECKIYGGEDSNIASASGAVIKKVDNKIYALTAAHFCVDDFEPDLGFPEIFEDPDAIPAKTFRARFMGINIPVYVEKIDTYIDLCLMSFSLDYKHVKVKKLKLAKHMPNAGDEVYTISAPLAIMSPDIRLHFSGYFGGCDHLFGCMFTIPAAPGSSGSLVYNSKGEIVSMIQLSLLAFQNVSVGPSSAAIKMFLKEYKDETGIKLY